jgi:hypothetical protein
MLAKIIAYSVIAFIVCVVIYAGSVILEAVLDFYNRPKVPMFWCHKHGYFKMEHCLPLFPDMGGTAQNSFVCPTCYREAVFTNPNKKR